MWLPFFPRAIPTYGILPYAMIVATSTQLPEWWLLWWKSDLWTLSHQRAAATRGKSLWAICSCLCSGLMVWQGPILIFTTTRKWCAIIYVTKCFGRNQLVHFPHSQDKKKMRTLCTRGGIQHYQYLFTKHLRSQAEHWMGNIPSQLYAQYPFVVTWHSCTQVVFLYISKDVLDTKQLCKLHRQTVVLHSSMVQWH